MSIVIIFLANLENKYSNEGVLFCKNAISTSQPYGLNSIITDPEVTNNSHKIITFDWEDLLITGKDGDRSISVGRCTYNKIDKEIVFLSIYSDNLISGDYEIIESLSKASPEDTLDIAKDLGLNDRQITWIKKYGARSFGGYYNPKKEIVNSPRITESDLLELDKWNIINLYPNKILQDQFFSVETKLSQALSKSL
jgi:hypothetical protein